MNRSERYFRARIAVLITGGALIAALFPMAGSVLAAVPNPPSVPALAPGSDSGTVGDGITNDTTPTFTGTALASSTVRLLVDSVLNQSGAADASTGTWSITTSALAAGTYSISATATDSTSGTSLPSAASSVSIFTSLGVTINQAATQADPAAASPINFTVVFTHPVTDFATGDVTLGGTAGATTAVVTATGTAGTTYNVAVSGMTASGTVTATVAASKATDAATNVNTASTSTDNTVTFGLGNKFLVTSSNYAPVPGSAVTITAQLANSAGTAVATSGLVVTWSSTGTGGSFSSATTTTNASGIATVTFTVSSTSGTVHTVTATSGAFVGTSSNITTTANPATLTLTRSHGMITYGESVTFSVQLGATGPSRADRSIILEYTSVGVPWATIATLTTNSSGFASFNYSPTRTGYVRARFVGTTDLGAATSLVYIVGVRQTVALNPHHAGTTAIARGTSITFRTTVRPRRADLAATSVTFRFYRKVSGSWVLQIERHILTDSAGVARTTFRFGSSGGWYVRAYAPRTPYNSISRFTLREYYLVP